MTEDTRTCKYCGNEFKDYHLGQLTGDIDKTWDEGYCDKMHRKAHEKQLIKEGRMESIQEFCDKLNLGMSIMFDSQYKDSCGQKIWFPKDGKPYYDRALGKTFKNIKEKQAFMKEKNIVMDGSSYPKNIPVEAGDMRSRAYMKKCEERGI